MLIVTVLYLAIVYLLFFKFELLPWNSITKGLTAVVGTVILTGFLVGLQGLTPSSTQAIVSGRVLEVAPQVSGRILDVQVEPNVVVQAGDVLFTIDPIPYEARVEELTARLALSNLRLEQYRKLAAKSAGTEFQVEQTEAEVKQLTAQLKGAEFDLANTVVTAPADGMVPRLFLVPGMQVSPSRSVFTFVDTDQLVIGALFQQKALQAAKVGDTALINFPAFPGVVYEAEVIGLPRAIGEGQMMATGQLPTVQTQRMTRVYPIYISLPEDVPPELRKIGLAATVYIHTEGAGIVGIVAVILQWIGTSMDAIV